MVLHVPKLALSFTSFTLFDESRSQIYQFKITNFLGEYFIIIMCGWWPSKVSVKGLSYRLTFLIDSQL